MDVDLDAGLVGAVELALVGVELEEKLLGHGACVRVGPVGAIEFKGSVARWVLRGGEVVDEIGLGLVEERRACVGGHDELWARRERHEITKSTHDLRKVKVKTVLWGAARAYFVVLLNECRSLKGITRVNEIKYDRVRNRKCADCGFFGASFFGWRRV